MAGWLEPTIKAFLHVAGGVLAMLGNGLIRWLFVRIDGARRPAGEPAPRARRGLVDAQEDLPGGRYIGVFERLATYVAVVTSFPAGIAVVLAVKGLGRYADLATMSPDGHSRKGELFIIGTFASLLWALLWAGAAYWAVRLW